jgi:hypothetical protein
VRDKWRLVASGLALAGAIWGAVAYQILWGNTSIVVTRSFVDTPLGLLALFPVRIVLFGIHLAEDLLVHHAVDFSRNHAWIGLTSALAGSLVMVVPFALGTLVARRVRRSA